jgi:hypothetical protein
MRRPFHLVGDDALGIGSRGAIFQFGQTVEQFVHSSRSCGDMRLPGVHNRRLCGLAVPAMGEGSQKCPVIGEPVPIYP